LLERKLSRLIRVGRLTIKGMGPDPIVLGTPAPDAPQLDVVVRVKDRFTAWKIGLRPGLYFGEAYMDGALAIEQGSLWDLLELCGRNFAGSTWHGRRGRLLRFAQRLWRFGQQVNLRGRARRNVAHHYDLSDVLFRHFLDADRQYSCAYFTSPHDTLEQAQAAKTAHIAAKLALRPGLRVLDIGCGWGGLALSLARLTGADVTGITLSQEQAAIARHRVEEAGLQDRVRIEVKDYREVEGRFDRIVSVGMFEHVGVPHYRTFFDTVTRLLAADGIALIHAIGRKDGPGVTAAWTRKYIFPGGYVPALSEVLPAVEQSGLWVTDIEVLRLHYAETLRHWRERFLRHRALIREIYDERFCRMWEFFLATSEMGFRYDNLMVFQMQLARRVDAVPLMRDYMFTAEAELRAAALPARTGG
jgi:cyclopropane-fatty-acyl-phospholipid synthase